MEENVTEDGSVLYPIKVAQHYFSGCGHVRHSPRLTTGQYFKVIMHLDSSGSCSECAEKKRQARASKVAVNG